MQERWRARLQTVAAWTAQHGHLRARQTTGDEPEFNMGYWLANQRSQLGKRRLPDDRLHALDAQLPGWRPKELQHAPFERVCFREAKSDSKRQERMLATAAAVVAFRAAHQRMPRRDGDDLGRWLYDRRTEPMRLNAEVKRVLDVQLPGWRDEPEVLRERQEAWQQMLGRLQRFVSEQQRLPRYQETAEGTRVGNWMHTQKNLHRKQRLAPDRLRALDEAMAGWSAPQRRGPAKPRAPTQPSSSRASSRSTASALSPSAAPISSAYTSSRSSCSALGRAGR